MTRPTTIAAFFDVDRTIVMGHTSRLYFRHLRDRGELGWRGLLRVSSVLLRYKLAVINMNKVMEQAAHEMRGFSEQRLTALCQEVFSERVIPRISNAAVEAIEGHRRLGHRIVLLTASTTYMIEPLSRHLACDDYLCTELAVQQGTLTGDFVRPMCFGEGKRYWAEQYAEEHSIDLKQSYFYTDSYTDLPMLLAVGHQRIVNPDPRLRLHALRRRWPVLRFNR
jgi:putative phosphoserine phosphatase/1-acylglycerol-3-phosphate O-acyltransferase